jgi:LysM repeat protein
MPDYKPNQFIRVFAVLALAVAFVAVIAVIATSGGGSDSGNDTGTQVKEQESKRGREAVDRGVWIVRSGDTLGHISEATGIDIDTLTQLNPDIDPQVLREGQRIQLR